MIHSCEAYTPVWRKHTAVETPGDWSHHTLIRGEEDAVPQLSLFHFSFIRFRTAAPGKTLPTPRAASSPGKPLWTRHQRLA